MSPRILRLPGGQRFPSGLEKFKISLESLCKFEVRRTVIKASVESIFIYKPYITIHIYITIYKPYLN